MPIEWSGLVTAFGLGLLIGIERERHKTDRDHRLAAGVRTFTLISLAGAIAAILGLPVVAVAALFVMVMTVASYRASQLHDPGLTTEVAMFLAFLLGVLAMSNAVLAAALGAGVTLVLAAKARLHGFIQQTLSEQELRDGLLLLGMVLIVLPVLPDRALDPWGIFNLQKLWRLLVLVLAINALGYVGQRLLGPRLGLPVSGFAGGFISATATIATMAAYARNHPSERAGALAAALLSNVATILQIAVVLSLLALPLLQASALALLFSGVTATLIGGLAGWHAWHAQSQVESSSAHGRAFDLRSALLFVCVLTVILLISALLSSYFGQQGVLAGVALAGFADVHAPVTAIAQLHVADNIDHRHALIAIGLAITTNSASKVIVAFVNGGSAFGMRILTGMLLIVGMFVFGLWFSS